MKTQKVFHLRHKTMTASLFPFGNGWRVKAVIVDRDSSQFVTGWDLEFHNRAAAQRKYNALCVNAEREAKLAEAAK
mgnify:CR=1 FL=1